MSLLKKQEASKFTVPNRLTVYSHAGMGKTKIMEGLKNAVLFDFEDRSQHIAGNVYNIKELAVSNGWTEVQAFGAAVADLKKMVQEGKKPDFVILDTFSSLEKNIIMPYATMKFNGTLIGKGMAAKGERVTDVVTELAKGGGYQHLFKAYEEVMGMFGGTYNICLIVNCHIKQGSKLKGVEELTADDIYATGKLGADLVQTSQAVAQLYKTDDNKVYLSFKHNERRLVTKASSPHLFDKDILISEMNPDGSFTFHWDSIFNPNEASN